MTVNYQLLTKRIEPGLYQHELFCNGKKVDYDELSEDQLRCVDEKGREHAGMLELIGVDISAINVGGVF